MKAKDNGIAQSLIKFIIFILAVQILYNHTRNNSMKEQKVQEGPKQGLQVPNKNQKQALTEALVLGIQNLRPEDKVNFLSGYICSSMGLLPQQKIVATLKSNIHNLSDGTANQIISGTNYIEILVEAFFYAKQFKNLAGHQLLEKFQSNLNQTYGEVAFNKKYLKEKWMKQAKDMSYTQSLIYEQKQKKEQASSMMDEQTEKMIKMLEEEDKKLQQKRKQQQKESQSRFKEFLKQEQQKELLRKKERQQKDNVKLSCEICLQDIPYTDVGTLSCGHIFHKSCIRGHIQALVSEKKIDIPCPSGCGKNLPLVDVEEYIDGELKEKFQKFCFDVYVQRNDKSTSWCPSAGCTAVFSHEGDLDNYRCPVCHKHYCLRCRCEYHKGMTCAQYRITNNYGEDDKKFQQFVRGAKFKQCPKCKYWVERSEGCSTMRCRCGHQFCYDCGGSDCPHGACKNNPGGGGIADLIRPIFRGGRRR